MENFPIFVFAAFQDAFLQKLLDDNYLSEEERLVYNSWLLYIFFPYWHDQSIMDIFSFRKTEHKLIQTTLREKRKRSEKITLFIWWNQRSWTMDITRTPTHKGAPLFSVITLYSCVSYFQATFLSMLHHEICWKGSRIENSIWKDRDLWNWKWT